MLTVAAAKTALNLAFSGRYGWQRDELYYAVAGRHLQAGYVEFPPVTAFLAAVSHALFGFSLVGLRLFAIAAGAGTTVVAALVARELGGTRRAQVFAAVLVGFSPLLIATNGLFQPVSFDQLATMVVLWLALRLALGRGSWLAVGIAVGLGLETKYTLAVVLVALVGGFLAWRRDALDARGLALACGVALLLVVPNLVWQARHDWDSVRWFLDPPASATDESRVEFVLNVLLLTGLAAVPVAAAGAARLVRDRALRPLGVAVLGTVAAYLVLGGKSYYAAPVVLFALAVGAVSAAQWSTRRVAVGGATMVVLLVVLLPVGLPVLPVETANEVGVIDTRTDYQDEIGWPEIVRTVERHAGGTDVVLAANYGEAGALEIFGRHLPPVASGHVSFRYWRPEVAGRQAVVVGYGTLARTVCSGDRRIVARLQIPHDVENEELGAPVVRCTLEAPLEQLWAKVVAHAD